MIFDNLEPLVENPNKSDKSQNKKESILLDSCFRAFDREELLTGADQWYCSKCKE
jgi:ubiquitin C-terminal hydrolase